MDALTYSYYDNSNKLSRVYDPIPPNRYGSDAGDVPDIDLQAENNYQYDEIGNLIKDSAEGITNIKWSVYGKILEISRTPGGSNPVNKIVYTYDAQGNRISKVLHKSNGTISYTWYVRDAQGNTLATYQSSGSSISNLYELPLKLSERHLYGSSRLGIYSATVDVDNGPRNMKYENAIKYIRGLKQYELTNHLGNVLATITDKKKGVDTNSDGFIDHYDADITTAQDYYPFGMLMPSRIGYQTENGWTNEPGGGGSGGDVVPGNIAIDSRVNNAPPEYTATNSIELNPGFQSGSGDTFLAYISEAEQGSGGGSGNNSSLSNGYYRYGFNGKENDNEVKGTGSQQDYGMRIYDPRLGRFLSEDPITKKYPELTPYQFASNRPIDGIDEDGLEWQSFDKDKKTISADDKENISGYRWVGFDRGKDGSLTPKAGTVATAYTFGRKGMTTLSTQEINVPSYDFQKLQPTSLKMILPKTTWTSYDDLSTGDASTDSKLNTLNPIVRNEMKRFVLQTKYRYDIQLRVTDGYRSYEQQDALYAKGRTKPGSIVTNARGGQSNHNFGLAIDVVPLERNSQGQLFMNWNTTYYPLIGRIGKSLGLEWGGSWKTIVDKPHFQNLQGKTLKELSAMEKDANGLPKF